MEHLHTDVLWAVFHLHQICGLILIKLYSFGFLLCLRIYYMCTKSLHHLNFVDLEGGEVNFVP